MIGCVVRDPLDQPDGGGISEVLGRGLAVRVLFSSPLNLDNMRDEAVITFTFVREGLTTISHS